MYYHQWHESPQESQASGDGFWQSSNGFLTETKEASIPYGGKTGSQEAPEPVGGVLGNLESKALPAQPHVGRA